MYPIIENARIERTTLGVEDHGFMTVWLHLSFGRGGQGFGGHALDDKPKATGMPRRPTAYGLAYIMRVMEAVGVDRWENLPGKHVRIARNEYNGLIVAIGHIIEDKWFDPAKLHAEIVGAK
jgi:hypothetical protein